MLCIATAIVLSWKHVQDVIFSIRYLISLNQYWETYNTFMCFREKKCLYEIQEQKKVSVWYTGIYRTIFERCSYHQNLYKYVKYIGFAKRYIKMT
jgi:hypothetical protein